MEVTFVTNGGTSVNDLTEQTALPNPLPTTTKANHVFAGWYYDNLFTQKATPGDELTTNVTLYAKWFTPTTWCEDIADAIREKEGSSEPIKHVDFADRIEALPSPKEEQTKTVSPTTSSQDVLPDTNKVLSKVTVNAIPTETKSQQPNLSSGDQVINATSGNFMTSFTITKDTINHIASNIRSGKTLYGVTGNMEVSVPVKLGTPTITLSSGIISWSAVTNATTYIIYKNGTLLSATQSTSYDTNSSVGSYKIKAVASGYIDSNFSNEVVIVLPKPTNLIGTKWKMNNTIEPIPYPGPGKSYDITGSMSSGSFTVSSTTENHQFLRKLSNSTQYIAFPLEIWGTNLGTAMAFHCQLNWVRVNGSSSGTQYTALTDDVILSITGGNDVTNSEYIDWLWSKAERIE